MKFPKNYRTITERISKFKKNKGLKPALKKEFLVILYSVLIFSILFFSFDLFLNLQKQNDLNSQREKTRSEIIFWKDIVSKFKDYKEGYYKLSVLEYELGEIAEAKIYLNKALYIDPNFEKARDFKKILDLY